MIKNSKSLCITSIKFNKTFLSTKMFQKITDKHVQYFETYILLFQHLFCLNNDIYDDNEHLPEL